MTDPDSSPLVVPREALDMASEYMEFLNLKFLNFVGPHTLDFVRVLVGHYVS
jgi:hypothetical protein